VAHSERDSGSVQSVLVAKPVADYTADITGVNLRFRVSQIRAVGPDVDNLVYNVLLTLERAGWFHKNKENVRWWLASRELNLMEAGVTIIGEANPIFPTILNVYFERIYDGSLPTDKKHKEYNDWILKNKVPLGNLKGKQIGVSIYYGSDSLNIADGYSSGKVKHIIDGLESLIGMDDTIISSVFVIKNWDELDSNEVKIAIWFY